MKGRDLKGPEEQKAYAARSTTVQYCTGTVNDASGATQTVPLRPLLGTWVHDGTWVRTAEGDSMG